MGKLKHAPPKPGTHSYKPARPAARLICAPICFQWVTNGESEENFTAETRRRGENERKSESAEGAEVTCASPGDMVTAVDGCELALAWAS